MNSRWYAPSTPEAVPVTGSSTVPDRGEEKWRACRCASGSMVSRQNGWMDAPGRSVSTEGNSAVSGFMRRIAPSPCTGTTRVQRPVLP